MPVREVLELGNPKLYEVSDPITNDELDSLALKYIDEMPKWNPGIKNGIKVRTAYTLPIRFK